jgi:methanogenic corrinoid protein MtbC1
MPQATDFYGNSFGSSRTSHELERFVRLLIHGDRVGCRDLVREFLDGHSECSGDATCALRELAWPACATLDALARRDQIGTAEEHSATVLLAQLVQRIECGLAKRPARCKLVVVATGPRSTEELAGEIFSGLAEADGFDILYLGGGVESDELFSQIAARRPAYFVSFAAAGPDAPRLRRLITAVRTQDPVPGLRLGVGGGVFERAPGLAEEIGAHFEANSPFDMLAELQRIETSSVAGHSSKTPRSRAA